jgi:ABC-type sugar transport system substrate-binding protein
MLTSCDQKTRALTEFSESHDKAGSQLKSKPAKEQSPDEDLISLMMPSTKKGDRKRIVVSAFDGREPMTYTRMRVLDRFAKMREGVEIAFWDAGGNSELQASQIQQELAKRPFAMFVLAQSQETVAAPLATAMAQKVSIIGLGCPLDESHCTTSIVVDEKKIGHLAGEFVCSSLKLKAEAEGRPETVGRVVQISGDLKSRAAQDRGLGFIEALSKSPGVRLVHDASANWDEKETPLRMAEALRLQKTFDVVFAQSDIMAMAASNALKAIKDGPREQMLVLGVDGSVAKGGGIDMVIKGDIDATVYNPPMVDLGWKVLVRLLDDPSFKPKSRYELEPFVITPEKATTLSIHGVPSPAL